MIVIGCQISRKRCYEDVRFNVIGVTRGVGGCGISRKKRYLTLECPLWMFFHLRSRHS